MSLELEVLPPPPPQPLRKITTTIDELWDAFTRLRGALRPSSLNHYRTIGRKFCTFMEGRHLDHRAIASWMTHLGKQNLNPSTVGFINTKVKAFLVFLKTMRYTHDDLASLIPKTKPATQGEPVVFTEEEYERIKAYCAGRERFQLHLWLIIVGYRTGLSLVDACHLRWCNVHLNENGPSYIDIHRIKIERFGGKSLCQIPIVPFTDLHEWLMLLKKQEHMNYRRHDGITDFVHQDAPGFYACSGRRIQASFNYLFAKAGVTGKTYRNFRNTFCSNLINSGVQAALVMKMTGHNNIKMLLHYTKPDRRALQDGLAASYQYSAAMAGVGKGSDPLRDNL